jgi:hypothetical protein
MAAKKRTKTTESDNRSEAEKRDEQRKQFVAQKKAQGVSTKEANTQFYVQTRVKEIKATGGTVDAAKRQQLRQNYASGQVKRAGFGVTPASGKPKPVTNTATKPVTNTPPKPEPKKNTNPTTSTRVQSVPDRMANPRKNQTMADRPNGRPRVQTVPDRTSLRDRAISALNAKHGVGDSKFFWSPDTRVAIGGNSNILGKHGAKAFVDRDLKNMGFQPFYNKPKKKK